MRLILLLSIVLASSLSGPVQACLRDDSATTRGKVLTRGVAIRAPDTTPDRPMATAARPAILKIGAAGAGADILRVTFGLPVGVDLATSKRIIASLTFRLPPPIDLDCGAPQRFPLGMVAFIGAGDWDRIHFDVVIADLPEDVRGYLLSGLASLKVEAGGLMIGEAAIPVLSVEFLKAQS
jgi:hypothetical protein